MLEKKSHHSHSVKPHYECNKHDLKIYEVCENNFFSWNSSKLTSNTHITFPYPNTNKWKTHMHTTNCRRHHHHHQHHKTIIIYP